MISEVGLVASFKSLVRQSAQFIKKTVHNSTNKTIYKSFFHTTHLDVLSNCI